MAGITFGYGALLSGHGTPRERRQLADDPRKLLPPSWAARVFADPRLRAEINIEDRFAEFAGEAFADLHDDGVETLQLLDGALAAKRR